MMMMNIIFLQFYVHQYRFKKPCTKKVSLIVIDYKLGNNGKMINIKILK